MGKILFYYGCMGSGKSLQLLSTAYNFQEHSIPFVIFKPSIDNRDGKDVIHSRALGDRECIDIIDSDNIYSIVSKLIETSSLLDVDNIKWILVDEAQFLTTEQVNQLAAIADNYDINIICYGLRTDFQTHLFPGSKRLFEIADSFYEIKSSCYCGKKTSVNARINSNKEIITDGEQVDVGGDDKYVALCRKCFHKKTNNKFYK